MLKLLLALGLGIPASAGEVPCEAAEVMFHDALGGQAFGRAFAVDAGRLVVAAYGDDWFGAVQAELSVWKLRGNDWLLAERVELPVVDAFWRAGMRVALRGAILAVAAPIHWGDEVPFWVFEESVDGWSPVTLDPVPPGSGAPAALVVGEDFVAVGFPWDDTFGPDAGAVHIHARGPEGWRMEGKLAPSQGVGGPHFGVALGYAGGVLAVAATGDDRRGEGAGAVELFERTAAGWNFIQRVEAPDASARDLFGASLAVDGSTLVVAAPGVDGNVEDTGAVYVFEETPRGWMFGSKLEAPDLGSGAHLGRSVALAGDWLAASTHRARPGPLVLYRRSQVGWIEEARLWPRDAAVRSVRPQWSERLGETLVLEGNRLFSSATIREGGQERQGSLRTWSLDRSACASLQADLVLGDGVQEFVLDRGPSAAGHGYVLLGSASGTEPGITFGPHRLPLERDAYLVQTVLDPWGGILNAPLGVLDAEGRARVRLAVPAELRLQLTDVHLTHAFVEFDPAGIQHVSNPVGLWLFPTSRF